MLLKSEYSYLNAQLTLGCALCLLPMFTHSQLFSCDETAQTASMLCHNDLQAKRQQLSQHTLTAFLVSDAPLRLLHDQQQIWLLRLKQCKSVKCYQQQFDLQLDQLNMYISLNQSLTQHYLKFEHGKLAFPAVHLQIHQLGKDSLKIEGIALRSPNNKPETQSLNFLAYTSSAQKNQITNNETDCKYQFQYSKALLTVKSQRKGCERFNGVYRLYD